MTAASRAARGQRPPSDNSGFWHAGLFYRAEAEYLAHVSRFARAGLRRGEPVLLAVPDFRIGPLSEALGQDADRMMFVDMTAVGGNPARIIPAVHAFLGRHPGRRVTCVGECTWPGRSPAELAEAARHEALANLAFADTPMTALCPFNTARLPAGALTAFRQAHPRSATSDGQATSGEDYLGPGKLPPLCELPLPDPPPHAATLGFRAGLQQVRALTADRAAAAGLPPARVNDLIIAVSELAANTLCHAEGPGILRIWQAAGELVCEIADRGWISDPLAGRHPPDAGLSGSGGLGLPLIHQVCDLVETRTHPVSGTTIRVHMNMPGNAAPPDSAGSEASP
jgi:anti-sigma regulatory factor (Ser/Thr protein kinase)